MLKAIPVIVLAALALAGCTPSDPAPSITPSTVDSSPEPSETASAAAVDTLDPDVLFTISVTATAPNGAIADLVQTVYKPVASTTQQAADEAALDGECDGWRAAYPAPEYLVSLIDVTDRSPDGASWPHSVAVVSMNGWPTFSGEVESFMAYCASVQVNLGSSRGVTPVSGAADAAGGWATFEYGFGIATEAGTDVPGPTDTVLSNCAIELSAEAQASAIASAWVVPSSPLSCIFRQ